MSKINKYKLLFATMAILLISGIASLLLKQGYGLAFVTISVIIYLRSFHNWDIDDDNRPNPT